MGSSIGGGSSKTAAKKQAAAIDRQTNLQTKQTNYQIQAMADQMATAAAQQAASEYAEKLLSAPPETVDITLGSSDLDLMTNDLIGRRRTNRQMYQRIVPTAQSRVTGISGGDLLL
jgi:hypothetical protein